MKIEDVELGKQYKSINDTKEIGIATFTFWNGGPERSEVHLSGDTGISRWFPVKDIEPVDESPKEAPIQLRAYPTPDSITATPAQAGIGMTINDRDPLMQFHPQGKPLSIADTPVSQMTYRMHLIAQGFAGWAASSRSDDRDIPVIPIIVDELIAEIEKTKK